MKRQSPLASLRESPLRLTPRACFSSHNSGPLKVAPPLGTERQGGCQASANPGGGRREEARLCKWRRNQGDSPGGKNRFLRRFCSSGGSGTHQLSEAAPTAKRLNAEPQGPPGLSRGPYSRRDWRPGDLTVDTAGTSPGRPHGLWGGLADLLVISNALWLSHPHVIHTDRQCRAIVP